MTNKPLNARFEQCHFNSINALSASADQYGLSDLVSALASNDPKRRSKCSKTCRR